MTETETAKAKKDIDSRSYESLLGQWRHAPTGHPYFRGDLGSYFAKVMAEKKDAIGHKAAVDASKSIGW